MKKIFTVLTIIFIFALGRATSKEILDFKWIKAAPGALDMLRDPDYQSFGMTTDPSGNLLIFGLQGTNYYIFTYDPNGTLLNQTKFGEWSEWGPRLSGFMAITTDAAGNIYFTGDFRQSCTFGTITLIDSSYAGGPGTHAGFIVKMDPSMNVVWARKDVNVSGNYIRRICVTPDGNSIYLARISSYLSKYDGDGNLLWTKSPVDFGMLDADGNIYLQEQTPETTEYKGEVIIKKCDPDGNELWGKSIQLAHGRVQMAMDHQGRLLITGRPKENSAIPVDNLPTTLTSTFDDITLSFSWPGEEMYLAMLDTTSRHFVHAIKFGYPGSAHKGPYLGNWSSLNLPIPFVDSANTIWLVGRFQGNLLLGSDTLNSYFTVNWPNRPVLARDYFFVSKLSAEGTFLSSFEPYDNTIDYKNNFIQLCFSPDNHGNMYLYSQKNFGPLDGDTSQNLITNSQSIIAKIGPTEKYTTFSQEDFAVKAQPLNVKKKILPNIGAVRDKIFSTAFPPIKNKQDSKYPGGLLLGIPQSNKKVTAGSIRFTTGPNLKVFLPNTAQAAGFSHINGNVFVKEVKNPNIRTYNNKLAGELLTLKMNIGASKAGLTKAGLGDLIFNDSEQPTNVLTGKTLNDISLFVDSTLTFYKNYYINGTTIPPMYDEITQTLNRINNAFRGDLHFIYTNKMRVRGVRTINEVSFLHESGKAATDELEGKEQTAPQTATLLSAYPSPFNPTTIIHFELANGGVVTMKVFNIIGQQVAILINNEQYESGAHDVTFDASNLPSGVYFVRLEAVGESGMHSVKTNKIMLIK